MDGMKHGAVTGAGGDIGLAACRELGRRGAAVLCVDRSEELANAGAKAVTEAGGTGTPFVADVTIEGDVYAYADKVRELWGEANFFFNNAGIEGVQSPIASYPVDAFQMVMDVNVKGVFLGLRAMFPLLHLADTPRVVNTAGFAGLMASPYLSAFAAAKHAVVGLTKTAAVEWAPRDIAVNALCPGPVEAGMMKRVETGIGAEEAGRVHAEYERQIPEFRYAKLVEIANVAVYLLLDAPMYLTGQAIAVDGGLSIA